MDSLMPIYRYYLTFIQNQVCRYAIVGFIALTVDISVMYTLATFFQLHYLYAAALGFLGGLAVNYTLSIYWVFHVRTIKNKYLEFGLFAVIGLIGLLWNEIFMFLFVDKFRIYYLYAKLITVALVFFWNYLARRHILFRADNERAVEG